MNTEGTEATVINPGRSRRASVTDIHDRRPSRKRSLSAEEVSSMTLEEILETLGLPERLVHGDDDHEETTETLDGLVLYTRHNQSAA